MARIEWLNERAQHIPPQTDPTVGLLRNMLRSFCICVIQSIWVPQVFYSSLRSSGDVVCSGAHRALFFVCPI